MTDLKRILPVEDNPNNIELTLLAFAERKLANQMVVTREAGKRSKPLPDAQRAGGTET